MGSSIQTIRILLWLNVVVDHQLIIPILLSYRRYVTIVVPKNFRLSLGVYNRPTKIEKHVIQYTQPKISQHAFENYIQNGDYCVVDKESSSSPSSIGYEDKTNNNATTSSTSVEHLPSTSTSSSGTKTTTTTKPRMEITNENRIMYDGKEVVLCVSGKTFHHKEELKQLGGWWNSKIKKWMFFDDQHESKLTSYRDMQVTRT